MTKTIIKQGGTVKLFIGRFLLINYKINGFQLKYSESLNNFRIKKSNKNI